MHIKLSNRDLAYRFTFYLYLNLLRVLNIYIYMHTNIAHCLVNKNFEIFIFKVLSYPHIHYFEDISKF